EFDRSSDSYLFYNDGVANVNPFFDEAVVRQFQAGDTIIVMCKTGGRGGQAVGELDSPSGPASHRLVELNLYNIYNMVDGFVGKANDLTSWLEAGLPYNASEEGIWKPSDHRGRSLK
ncbi:MAG: hypothetical protein R6T90_00120, partial [Dissulfuribacterales bacterium]